MFIARTAYTNILSPRGATGALCLNHRLIRIERIERRRDRLHLAPEGRYVYRKRHAPNTLKPQRGDRCALSQSPIRPIKRIARRRVRLHLAPEGQHVYRTRDTTNIQSPRGATGALCLNHGLIRIQRIERRRERLYLAPAGRYVYSTHGMHKYLKPQRGDRCALSQSPINTD